MCSSTAFPCVGQVEQWVGEHLLPHLLKHKIEAKAEIVLETSFTVWERIAVREIKTDSRPKKRRK